MNTIRVGDTVAFRPDVAAKCKAPDASDYRGVVTGIAGNWLFIEESTGKTRVMLITDMARVASNGTTLEAA